MPAEELEPEPFSEPESSPLENVQEVDERDAPVVQAAACDTPEGVSGAPQSVAALLELINALPKPVTIACLLESLERPLEIYMTSSTFSAQPAGFNSPRTFLFFGPLAFSIVPGGSSQDLLEFGEVTPDERSIKGEILFPVVDDVGTEQLLERVGIAEGYSICGGCHVAEVQLDDQPYDAAFESVIITPLPMYEVTIAEFKAANQECNYEFDGTRCRIIDALFEHGPVRRTLKWQ